MVGCIGLQGIDEVSAPSVNQREGGGKRVREGNPASEDMDSRLPGEKV